MDKLKLLGKKELKAEWVDVDVDGEIVPVLVRELSLDERIEFESNATEKDEQGNPRYGSWSACLIVASVVDAGGNRAFDWEEATEIGAIAGTRFQKVIEKARDLSMLGKAGLNKAKKNSLEIQSDGSSGSSSSATESTPTSNKGS